MHRSAGALGLSRLQEREREGEPTMQLRSFMVQGFKNFRQPVVLDDLGPINVIHGPNNVGKSNLLQAMELFFFLIGQQTDMGVPLQQIFPIAEETLKEGGFPRTEIFSLDAPAPIVIAAEVDVVDEDFTRAGLAPIALPVNRVSFALELRWLGTRADYTIRRFQIADGRDFQVVNRSHEENMELSALAFLLAQSMRPSEHVAYPRFGVLGVHRSYHSDLALALYDAKESTDIDMSRRWGRFVDAMSEFGDILGEGLFVAIYKRKEKEAALMWQTGQARIPLELLGSGVQQLAAMFAMLLVAGSTLVGIEEPELNLRYTHQLRLREVLAKLVGGGGGLDQIFITSHSDAFESGTHFYYMQPTLDGPRVEKRGVEVARASLGLINESAPINPNAALCYISSEGVVRVPERIRKELGLPHGGGIVFLQHRDTNMIEVMSGETFAERYEPKRDEGDGEHT